MKEITNKTPLSRVNGKIRVNCMQCGAVFFRAESHVLRRERNFCSKACAHEAMRIEVHTNCVVCGKDMVQTPSNSVRVVTCSKECSSIRKRNGKRIKTRNLPEYKSAVNAIREIGECCNCGRKNGPWVVRGLLPDIDIKKSSLWCRTCHYSDCLRIARDKKIAKPESIESAKRMLEKYGYSVTKADDA